MTHIRPKDMQVIDLLVEVAGIEPADEQFRTDHDEAGFGIIGA